MIEHRPTPLLQSVDRSDQQCTLANPGLMAEMIKNCDPE